MKPSDAFTIRRAVAADARVIAEFNIAMALETEQVSLDPATVNAGVAAGIADPAKAAYFVAEAGGRCVGCCMITHEWSDWRNGDIWWFQSVYVALEARRTGVFRAMYRHIERMARDAGVVALRLYVERDNQRAKQTYESMGMDLTHYDVMQQQL